MLKKIQAHLVALVLVYLVLLVTVRVAHAATQLVAVAAASEDPLFELARLLWVAVSGGEFVSIAVAILVMLSALLARFGVRLTRWFGTSGGRAVITLLVTFFGGLSAALAAGTEVTWAVLRTVFVFAATTAGGYSLIKALVIEPLTPWMRDRAPDWLHLIWRGVSWVYDRLAPPAPSQLPLAKIVRQRASTHPERVG